MYKIESLLFLCIQNLGEHSDKVAQIRRKKELWKQRMTHVGLPHIKIIEHFGIAYTDWKNKLSKLLRNVLCCDVSFQLLVVKAVLFFCLKALVSLNSQGRNSLFSVFPV